MTKWLITYSHQNGARWAVVGFEGERGAESRGVVDLVAIRKDHRASSIGTRRGDLFELILIQVKGGSARRPSAEELKRLSRVSKHHRAKGVVLAEWHRGGRPKLFELQGTDWRAIQAGDIF